MNVFFRIFGVEKVLALALLHERARAKEHFGFGLEAVFQAFLINVSFRVICSR
ncbi:hypothetical protein [Ruegeria conchae]|uniref:hypothetical protein n=1 Tax=Ruegeria conchae TaxID=981384 RepID=UPI0029C65B5F|nr:hypothetical protein [Ruegeria conchae]